MNNILLSLSSLFLAAYSNNERAYFFSEIFDNHECLGKPLLSLNCTEYGPDSCFLDWDYASCMTSETPEAMTESWQCVGERAFQLNLFDDAHCATRTHTFMYSNGAC